MNKKIKAVAVSLCTASFILVGCTSAEKPITTLALSGWSAADQSRFLAVEQTDFPGNPEVKGFQGAVSGSFHGRAQRAGLEALKQGGSSADAAMTTAMAQVALGAGAVISYFGIMSVVHFDAASGEVSYMNAGWNTVEGEKDPMSIPGQIGGYGDALYGTDEPSGRTALVGGFMKGVEAMNGRFGKLPFKRLFEPSIEIAEKGIQYSEKLDSYVQPRKKDLSRLPETKAIFVKENGEWYQNGDNFTQPALAKTLKAVAEQGADYLYTGPWAKKAIAAVQKDGGHMTLGDLASYEVIWGKPLVAKHGEFEVYANGLPAYGGVNMIEALNLSEAAQIKELGHWSESAESFRRMAELLNAGNITYIEAAMPSVLDQIYPGLDLSKASRLKKATAVELWKRMEAGAKVAQWHDKAPKHSDTVVAVDKWGNMTAVVHSINCVVWGKTAIIVDGISVGDPAVSQKAIVAQAGPGKRLPDPTESGLLLKNGKPIMAFSSMSMGLHLQTAQSLINVMDFGMTPKQALDAPAMFYPKTDIDFEAGTSTQSVRVMKGDFPIALLEEMGLAYEEIAPKERRYAQGLWIGIARDPETGELNAASHAYTNGQAVAY
jgi:gamma-glutamyltranspeptidase/glutathione hydrolase